MNMSINEHFKTLLSRSDIKTHSDYRQNTVLNARYL